MNVELSSYLCGGSHHLSPWRMKAWTAWIAFASDLRLWLLATSGGYDAAGERWEHLQYLPYDLLRRTWQWHLLSMIRKTLETDAIHQLVDACFTKYPNGLVTNVHLGEIIMRFTLISFCAGSLALLLAQAVEPATALNSAQWMEQSAAYIGRKPLNAIVIPSTHDSGTYALISSWLRPANDVFAPDAESGMVKFGSFSNITENWAKAQEKTVYEQLNDGIRSLDLRPCVEKNGTLRICHGLYGPTLSETLKDIRKFADQHPKEIVIVGFGGFSQTKHGDMDATNVQRVKDLINAELAPRLVNHSGISPTSTVNEIWEKNLGKSLIILFGHSNSSGFWGDDKQTGSWKDTWNIDEKKQSLQDALNTAPANTLFSFSGAATPNANCIGLGILAGYPKSLADLANGTNPAVLGWVKNEWANKRVNLVFVDFYNKTCLLQLALHLNGVPDVSFAGCSIGDNQVWAGWRGSKSCPSGFRDDGAYCYKPESYGRGAGYPWQFGDPLDDSSMFARCEADKGKGNCEKYALVVYPKCETNFHAAGCCVCSPDCPAGMKDIGISCEK